MICSASFTSGAGFAGMREYLRRTADEGWIIDLSPEGHQPPMSTRVFRGNQQPICIAVFIRRDGGNRHVPALIHRTAVEGTVDEKYAALHRLDCNGSSWQQCVSEWSAPFGTAEGADWHSMPATIDLFPWAAPGVKPNRTWVYAPEPETLARRWTMLTSSEAASKVALFKESDSRKVNQSVREIPGMLKHKGTIQAETRSCPRPCRVAYRSFDRQWVIPDARVHHRPSPPLWYTYSANQIFINEQHTQASRGGIGLVFTNSIPDMDHFMGHHGGRVLPLYRDSNATNANVAPGLLAELRRRFQSQIGELDLISYVAAVTAHSGYTLQFAEQLKHPGVRIPLTAEPELWKRAVGIGREVIWLHTYGERCVDEAAGRPSGVPRMFSDRPKVLVTIPDAEEGMPDRISYDEQSGTLEVGGGRIAPVSPEVWNYHVSGMNVIRHWFGYRKKYPSGKRQSELDRVVAKTWTVAMTTELLSLLNVLGRCVTLEPRQAQLLNEIMSASQVTVSDLIGAGVLPVPAAASGAPKPSGPPGLWAAEAPA